MDLASTPTKRLEATMMTGTARAQAMLAPDITNAHATNASISEILTANNMTVRVRRLAVGRKVG